MRKSTQNEQATQVVTSDGLYINGTCTGRTRRMVGEDGSKELITYKIQTHGSIFYVKDWDANGVYISTGETVAIPIKVQSYSSKGSTRIDFTYYRPRDVEF